MLSLNIFMIFYGDSFKELGVKLSKEDLHSILSQIDTAYNGQMELSDYLQVKCRCFL